MVRINIGDDIFLPENEAPSVIDTLIHVSFGQSVFPDEQWTDYAYPIICHWAETLLTHRKGGRSDYCLPFMDGSFQLDVHQSEDMALYIRGVHDDSECRFECTCTYNEFLNALKSAFRQLSGLLHTHGLDKQRCKDVYHTLLDYEKRLNRAVSES